MYVDECLVIIMNPSTLCQLNIAKSSDNEMLASFSSTSFKPDWFSRHWHLPRGDLFFWGLVRVPLNL